MSGELYNILKQKELKRQILTENLSFMQHYYFQHIITNFRLIIVTIRVVELTKFFVNLETKNIFSIRKQKSYMNFIRQLLLYGTKIAI